MQSTVIVTTVHIWSIYTWSICVIWNYSHVSITKTLLCSHCQRSSIQLAKSGVVRTPEKHVFLSWSCNPWSKFTSGLTLQFKTTSISKCVLHVRQNAYLWEGDWVLPLPQTQACMCLWMWLGTFEKTIKASETIKISPFPPSAPQFFGISLSDEQSSGVSSALWGPGLTVTLPAFVPGLSQGMCIPILIPAYSQDTAKVTHTEEGKAGRSSQSRGRSVDLWTDVNGVTGLVQLVTDTCPRTKGRRPGRFGLPEMLSTDLVCLTVWKTEEDSWDKLAGQHSKDYHHTLGTLKSCFYDAD